ncbi:MAG: Hpt domain-containing protein [Chloroflexi bacterium]|nr:Hpt domain-containing protein [Chloroflexota bacterium]
MGILDPAALKNLHDMVGGDSEFMVELMNTFLDDAPQMLADMHNSLKSGDATLLRRAAHSLKSNCAEFGAMTLSELCRKLEEIGKEGTLSNAKELVGRAETEFTIVKTALEAERDKLL